MDELANHPWGIAAVAAVMVAIICALMEKRRNDRVDLERVGFMPWNLIMVLSLIIGAFAAGLGLRGL
ncbi:hypothetical protein [Alterisphingorhabdus coralli]|uniref:Uncharacterized protein n=1 Tax=Alterisphingorhabdus coralli TaxID=3071408 RepID=A0AA97HZT6_9SPHN|nr:hypothetical protein [Parasphingorhabdus sp. SCSIO 66989]WOE74177.1 hypothetical protein RB602_09955 [Parasphingorhabdus sp. SCSIO 66989]